MTEQEKMLTGALYFPSDKTLTAMRKQCRIQLDELNSICQSEHKTRTRLLKQLFGSTGKRLYMSRHLNVITAKTFMLAKTSSPISIA